jgi:hypothetical protein
MAKLTLEAMKLPEFVKLVKRSSYRISPTNKHPEPAVAPAEGPAGR